IPHALISLLLMIFYLDPKYNRMILTLSFVMSALFIYLISTAQTLVSMSLYHSGLGIALGFVFPILLSEEVGVSPAELKMSAMGDYQSCFAFGIVLDPIIAGCVGEIIGLEGMLITTIILSFISIFILINTRKT